MDFLAANWWVFGLVMIVCVLVAVVIKARSISSFGAGIGSAMQTMAKDGLDHIAWALVFMALGGFAALLAVVGFILEVIARVTT